ncbi:MAG: tRNA (N6-threonylcarbamoyladenosine(37)-N6)-methyltransferase TrmO [Gammaproteobacteria bacterium]|nr:tRNA (N6-threonylcarbamoyladenosine(37)-N6)-methyltransferase TrmO [Gammaproteobacteria bacterium]
MVAPGAPICARPHIRGSDLGATFRIEPIARIRSPFDEKFGTPRQAGLVPGSEGTVELLPPYDDPSMLEGLAGFSHIWLTFVFDRCVAQGWRPRVRPPRLGGNAEVGVWASRSPFRPNFLGLSAVRLIAVIDRPRPLLRVSGLDLVDGTPVVDIRPYLPYADVVPDASGGFAPTAPSREQAVRFSPRAIADLETVADAPAYRRLITEVLTLDPRPAYRSGAEPGRVYGMSLSGRNVRWRVDDEGIEIIDITRSANR